MERSGETRAFDDFHLVRNSLMSVFQGHFYFEKPILPLLAPDALVLIHTHRDTLLPGAPARTGAQATTMSRGDRGARVDFAEFECRPCVTYAVESRLAKLAPASEGRPLCAFATSSAIRVQPAAEPE